MGLKKNFFIPLTFGKKPKSFFFIDFFFVQTAQKERVSRLVKDGKLVSYMYDDARTLYEGFRRGAKVSGKKKKQQKLTWQNFLFI